MTHLKTCAAGRPGMNKVTLWFLCCLLVCGTLFRVVRPALALGASDLCRTAAARAAAESGVPNEVLVAITLAETGRSAGHELQPWPWTINAGGEGHWFPDRAAAMTFANSLLAAGQTNFDVGCFQINLRWHGAAFASLDAMFDPDANARDAARFLAGLAREGGGWSVAAGAYHSRTQTLAQSYRARFDAILASQGEGDDDPPAAAQPMYGLSGYDHPLLQARDGSRTPGSLVTLPRVPAS